MTRQNYCEVLYTNFIWNVKYPNFFLGCDIRSPNFSVDSYGNAMFYVKLLSEMEDENRSYVSIYLAKHESYCGLNQITFNIKLSVTDKNGNEYIVADAVDFNKRHTILLERHASFKKNKAYHPNSVFTVQLEIEPTEEDTEERNLWVCNHQDLEKLSTDLSRALKAKRFCDLTFRSIEGVKSVTLHRSVLAARYPNLAATLDFGKNTKLDCNLGVDFEAIKMLTQYLYSGNIDTGSTTYGLHDILKRADLEHLEHVLYPAPRIIHASTSVPSKYGSFIWIISKFSSLQQGKVLINTFCFDSRLEWTKIRILLYITEIDEKKECLALKILRTEQDRKMYMLCKISLVGDEDKKYCKIYEHIFQTEREFIIKSFVEKKLIKEKKDCFLHNDTLKMSLEFIISDLRETSEYECVKYLEIKRGQFSLVAMNLWALQRDLKRLYLDPTYTDFTLQVREEFIPAHRVILSARSPRFSKMLESNTEENETGRVLINDFSTLVVRNMLRYIYCGEISEELTDTDIVKLYEAAHTYQVVQLTEKCSRLIGSLLRTDTVSNVLKFSDEYNDKYLKECVKKFVCCHADKVFESEEWMILMEERIDLTAGIMNAALESVE